MFNETLQLYTIFVVCIVCVQSISITSIVSIKCNSWRTNPIQGCIGTFILPNVVLTTSYCAENCQYIGNTRIVKSYIHPHYKNYVHGDNFVARNDIALLVTPQDGRRRKLVKLSALDSESTLGLKALIPIMDKNKPRLKITLIERCNKKQPFGYYVCTNNKISKQTVKVCQGRQEQGVPLLLEDRIFGIMGITDVDSCTLPQRSFTAVGPALYWISTTVKKLGYSNDVITTLHDRTETTSRIPTTYSFTETTTPVITSTTTTATTSTTSFTTTTTSTTSTASPITTTAITLPNGGPNPHLPSDNEDTTPSPKEREKIREEETKQKAMHYLRNVHKFVRRDINALLPSSKKTPPIMRVQPRLSTKPKTTAVIIRRQEDDFNAAITFIPLPTTKSLTRTTRATTTLTSLTTRAKPTTILTSTFIKALLSNKTTNVMDWFNVMVKDKLKNNPSMYYIVSSSTTTRKPITFIDLT